MTKTNRSPARVRHLLRQNVNGHPYGVWIWRRRYHPGWKIKEGGKRIEKWGLVVRSGPLGHVQFQEYLNTWPNGRRNKREWMISWWGVNGRRRKRGIGIQVYW